MIHEALALWQLKYFAYSTVYIYKLKPGERTFVPISRDSTFPIGLATGFKEGRRLSFR